jgi:hypothetical protein
MAKIINNAFIRTFTGKVFDVLNASVDDICIEDIAHSLAYTSRFGGHLNQFFSIAQHSLIVEEQCVEEEKLWGLLHDATEAYLSDVVTPLKKSDLFKDYRIAEKKLEKVIFKKFGLVGDLPKSVDLIDKSSFYIEIANFYNHWPEDKMDLLPNYPVKAMTPAEAEATYLKRFYELINR